MKVIVGGEEPKFREPAPFSGTSSNPHLRKAQFFNDNDSLTVTDTSSTCTSRDGVDGVSLPLSKRSSFSSLVSCSTYQDSITDASSSLTIPGTGTWWPRCGTPTSVLDHHEHYDIAAKVILLGDYNVGKTSILKTLSRATDEDGNDCCKEYRPAELAELVFRRNGKKAMVRVMDTGGQERYRSMTSSYYRGVHGCMLVYDVTKEETFNNIMSWHQDLQKYSTDQFVAAIIVGTTSHPGERAVSVERGFKMAESLGIPYMECSPGDVAMTLAIVQRLMEKIVKVGLRRTSFVIEIKPQALEAKKPQVKRVVCLC